MFLLVYYKQLITVLKFDVYISTNCHSKNIYRAIVIVITWCFIISLFQNKCVTSLVYKIHQKITMNTNNF